MSQTSSMSVSLHIIGTAGENKATITLEYIVS